MPAHEPLWRDHEHYRLVRPNAHLYIRHDAHRFMPPGRGAHPPNVAQCTGKRGRWTPERDALELAEQARLEAVERRETLADFRALLALKSEMLKLRSDLAFERFKRAALRWLDAALRDRKANFDPTQPRWPAGSGRISGRWSGGAGTGGPVDDPKPTRASPTLTDETPDNTWKPGAQYAARCPSRGRGGRGPIIINGRAFQPTVSKSLRLEQANFKRKKRCDACETLTRPGSGPT
jgi:hypothetical protein